MEILLNIKETCGTTTIVFNKQLYYNGGIKVDKDNMKDPYIDMDGDGMPDTEMFDTDQDGTVDTFLTDQNHDGVFETTMIDANQDGIIENTFSDLNGDGAADSFMADTNNDGFADTYNIDTNNDGYSETYMYDSNGDGIVDTEMVDTNMDGYYDVQNMDTDSNQSFDTEIVDTNLDGTFDTQIVDTDGDGILDTQFVDTNSDGMIDTQIVDSNGDGVLDTQMIDVNGDGKVDVVMMDTDGDGFLDTEAGDQNNNVQPTGYDDNNSVHPTSYEGNSDEIYGNPEEDMDNWHMQTHEDTCAVVSQEFILDELTGHDFTENELMHLAEENGWYTPGGGTSFENVGKILEAYGINVERTYDNSLEDIAAKLESGEKIIVGIDSNEIWSDGPGELLDELLSDVLGIPDQGADHAVEVIGIDNSDPNHPVVILNDPGHPDGMGMRVPADEFVEAWEDSGTYMVSTVGAGDTLV